MAGKGFYIVLLLCVAALGVSGYYLFSGMNEDKGQPVAGPAQVVVTPSPTVRPTPVPPPTATPRPTAAVPTPTAAPTAAPEPTAKVTATATVFTWPVKGEVQRTWSLSQLVYDETMGDWRTHDGVDISAAEGTAVMAPAGGTVSDVYTDDQLGTTVVILHANGILSSCANLESVPTVEIGDTVKTGDVIGSVGKSALNESAQASHLHLSMTRDGVSVDPLDFLPAR